MAFRTNQIVTFTDLRERMGEHFAQASNTRDPLVVTRNGRPEVVVVSCEVFDWMLDEIELLHSLRRLRRAGAELSGALSSDDDALTSVEDAKQRSLDRLRARSGGLRRGDG
ncbi:MAG: type II toxin-antitoxin system Phd/YefM family antitoxin [Myxococcales bacterium]|nr:type II toxin-antitoxin system Phd/YefM family antitoxin [Myxococcales bacterium]